ncbi:hypothetical protein M8J77_005965 [Diaphorina citri]|nr:hypothetical protein M8J77_005965 [Diaphorina citri]
MLNLAANRLAATLRRKKKKLSPQKVLEIYFGNRIAGTTVRQEEREKEDGDKEEKKKKKKKKKKNKEEEKEAEEEEKEKREGGGGYSHIDRIDTSCS